MDYGSLAQLLPMVMQMFGGGQQQQQQGVTPFAPKMAGGGGQSVFSGGADSGQGGFPSTLDPQGTAQASPNYSDMLGKMGMMMAQNSQQKPQQMAPMPSRPMGAPQPQQLSLPKNPSQPVPMGMAPLMGGQAVQSGPGAGVLSPQDIQQLMLLMQNGQRVN